MDSVCRRFNIYLLAVLGLLVASGCASPEKKKKKEEEKIVTSMRVHAQANSNTTFTKKVSIFKDNPVTISVDQYPLLTDDDVVSAQVVDALGGYALVIKFDKRGQWLLDEHSSLNLGHYLAIFVQYGETEKSQKAHWIAAPIISRRISDGALIFTPDVTREDAVLIAKGLVKKKTGLDKPDKDDKPWP